MPVWVAMGSTLGLNVARHFMGRSTLCSSSRKHIPADVMDLALAAGVFVLRRHYRKGFL